MIGSATDVSILVVCVWQLPITPAERIESYARRASSQRDVERYKFHLFVSLECCNAVGARQSTNQSISRSCSRSSCDNSRLWVDAYVGVVDELTT